MSNEPSENWDDDFLFQISDPTRTDRNLSYDNPETTNISRSTTHIMPHDSSENTTRSRFSINSAAWEDPEAGPSKPPPLHEHDTRPTPNLPPWSEATVPHMFANDEFSPSGGRDLDRTVTTRRKGKQTQFATASASSLANPSDKSWAEAPDDGMYDRDFEDEPVSTDNDNRALRSRPQAPVIASGHIGILGNSLLRLCNFQLHSLELAPTLPPIDQLPPQHLRFLPCKCPPRFLLILLSLVRVLRGHSSRRLRLLLSVPVGVYGKSRVLKMLTLMYSR
ncbi:hypothetical protein BS47DRAFT_119836 [Hydnum rufescens UP504]|uniref:Uncharacterized protein n=1 Tax=Hydnum rufescens UP504 TaxID=1448309 RepID=A0A9P6B776_9AGAM|nr:hypothetical protein BS47DRAFT_119836 [Hydnum rufescens UP504]